MEGLNFRDIFSVLGGNKTLFSSFRMFFSALGHGTWILGTWKVSRDTGLSVEWDTGLSVGWDTGLSVVCLIG